MFDLENDPYEQHDLAASDIANRKRLRRQLLKMLAATREPYFDVLIEHGIAINPPTIDVSDR